MKFTKFVRRIFFASLLAVGLTCALITPGQAASNLEINYGKVVPYPGLSSNVTASNATPEAWVGVRAYGDYIYVMDRKRDGRSAVGFWHDTDGDRAGVCRNIHGAGTTIRCNKNFPENHVFAMHIGTARGSEITYGSFWEYLWLS